MNILAQYSWLKEYLKTNASPAEFAREISLKSMSVESSESFEELYDHMVVGVIRDVQTHPNADKLKIALVDIGRKVEIVCGGINLVPDMKVLVALPGAKVRWHGQGDLVELSETEIRGVKSAGMICAPDEVGFEKLGLPEKVIWDLTDWTDAKAGTPFAKAMNLDGDCRFDIEITTNRPDAMSIVGLGREASAALDAAFQNPSTPSIPSPSSTPISLSVDVKDKSLCPRYMAVVMKNVKVGPSPKWLQLKLLLAGHRPINNIVDITNYVLHEYGQPLHAFDYDTLEGNRIIVRVAKDGEKLLALDGKEYELTSSNLVIADATRSVAIAGVMGGQPTGTSDATTTIVFEAASFDPVSVRRTSRALNLQSDSQLIFEKGLSTQLPPMALARAVQLAQDLAGAEVASEVLDVQAASYKPLEFTLRPDKVRAHIGADISDTQMTSILTRLGFVVNGDTVTVPFWRDHDIEEEVDLTEEIARIYGYHNVPGRLPASPPPSQAGDTAVAREESIKYLLASSGYTEFYGYSMVSGDDLKRDGVDLENAVRLYNPLSTDLEFMRPTLMPSVLRDIERNQGEVPSGRVFELARIYLAQQNDLPQERTELVIAQFGMPNVERTFLELKGFLEMLGQKYGLAFEVARADSGALWHPTRSAFVRLADKTVGMIGAISTERQKSFGINAAVVALELDLETLIPLMRDVRRYEPIPAFPAITRDLAVVVAERTEWSAIATIIRGASPLVESVGLSDVYRSAGVPEGKKSVTVSVTLRAPDRTLSSEHADDAIKAITKSLETKFDAILR